MIIFGDMQQIAKYRKEIQVVMESLIIVIGVLLNWSFGLVLFYILLDMLAKFVTSILMWNKMTSVRPVSKEIIKNERLFLVLNVLFLLSSMHVITCLVDPPMFLAFEIKNIEFILEAGMAEFWLLPLVVLAVYLNFRNEFIRGMEYRIIQTDGFFKRRSLEILPVGVAALGLLYFKVDSRDWILIVLAMVKLVFEFPLLKLEKRLMKQNLNKGF